MSLFKRYRKEKDGGGGESGGDRPSPAVVKTSRNPISLKIINHHSVRYISPPYFWWPSATNFSATWRATFPFPFVIISLFIVFHVVITRIDDYALDPLENLLESDRKRSSIYSKWNRQDVIWSAHCQQMIPAYSKKQTFWSDSVKPLEKFVSGRSQRVPM